MTSARGIVSATLLAAAGVLFAPAFAQAAGESNFSGTPYGAQLEVVVSQLPLLVVLVSLLVLGIMVVRL